MYKNLSPKGNQVSVQSFQLGEALRQLPLQYIKVCTRPSVSTLSEAMGQASWRLVLVQFLSLVIITITLSFVGHIIPSAALHGIIALSIRFVRPLGWLPFPLNEITFVLVSFFIGLGIMYRGSKVCSGQGTFLAHLYCLLLCTIPLVAVSGALLLLPAHGWLLLIPGGVVSALFIYRMVLSTFTIMAVHRLKTGQAIIIVLIIPIAIAILATFVIVGLLFITHGEFLVDLCSGCIEAMIEGRGDSEKKQQMPQQ